MSALDKNRALFLLVCSEIPGSNEGPEAELCIGTTLHAWQFYLLVRK